VAVFKETASGADNVRPERAKDPGVARAHEIDAILVTELSRWGRRPKTLSKRSTICTAGALVSWLRRSQLRSQHGEREADAHPSWPAWPNSKSCLAAARVRDVKLGRQLGQRPSNKEAKRVLGMHADGLSYRLIARSVGWARPR
jgi:putative DNA-invertase from lambdoid prophage Rac